MELLAGFVIAGLLMALCLLILGSRPTGFCRAGRCEALEVRIISVHGRGGSEMKVLEATNMLNTKEAVLQVLPRTNGLIDTSVSVEWSSSNPEALPIGEPQPDFQIDDGPNGVVLCPGSFRCKVATPKVAGAGLIFAKASGRETVAWPLTYEPAVDGDMGASPVQVVDEA